MIALPFALSGPTREMYDAPDPAPGTRPTNRRNRSQDRKTLTLYVFSVFDAVPVTEKAESFELGANLTVKDAAYVLNLPRRCIDKRTGTVRHSPEQLRYCRSLIRELPQLVVAEARV